ncbi:MAG: hypothetical protein HZB42_04710 [Sphingobacteriales bacterium]|nr:hypothetical protein [Sphingobacteriales bacterium]
MKKLTLLLFLHSLFVCSMLFAQSLPDTGKDTLPGFSVKNAGNNRIIIGWTNKYPVVKQISIQRSYDSLLSYKTILTVADPMALQNGYLDAKAPTDRMFYRLYILLDKGIYLFSKPQRPVIDTFQKKFINDPLHNKIASLVNNRDTFLVDGKLVVIKSDTVLQNGKPVIIRAQPVVIKLENLQWGDSVAVPNPDYTKPKMLAFTPSLRIFTSRDGYVRVSIPDDEKSKKITIKFFDDANNFLFELKDIKETDFKIDKANFYHAGWFRFELYENGKLLEKHKFYLEKDF